MNVLVVAPHADDEVLGCGGSMARHAANGDAVHVLIATRGIEELYSPEGIEIVRREAQAAHQILGVTKTHFLEFPAPALDTVPRYKIAAAVAALINELEIQQLYIPHHGDIHSDHLHLHHACLVAARPLAACPVRRILAYETVSETEWAPPQAGAVFYPTIFHDVSDYLEKKLSAMQCYETQLHEPPSARSLRTIEALARFRGATISRDAAEAFMLIREISD
jgi:LmbE family N-acetylglucosaminyl deacetylase